MKYLASFEGRVKGALGIFVRFENVKIDGKDQEEARLNLYNEYEHIHDLKLINT